ATWARATTSCAGRGRQRPQTEPRPRAVAVSSATNLEVQMAIVSTALLNFLIILGIGIVAGLLFNRYARTWLARLAHTSRSDFTAALVGIAGSFIGFHISVILGLLPSPLMHYILAGVGALAVLWFWRGR